MTPPDATQGEEARVTEEQMARLKALSIDTLLDIGQRPTPPPQLVEDVHALLSSHEALLERVARAERAAEEGWSLFYEYADDPQAILSARAKEATP